MEELRTISQMALDRCSVENLRDWNSLKSAIKGDVSDYLFKKTKRSPTALCRSSWKSKCKMDKKRHREIGVFFI